MVILEGGGSRLPSTNNQYLQPDYLSSLPTTLDAKKSPLALLAQTCSQIGVDTSMSKPSTEKSRRLSVIENIPSSPTESIKSHKQESISAEHKLKLCEQNVVSKKSDTHIRSKCSVQNYVEEKRIDNYNSERQSISPATDSYISQKCESDTTSPESKSTTPSTRCASPMTKSTNENIQEQLHDPTSCVPTSAGLTSSSGSSSHMSSSSGMEQINPAFRSTYPGVGYNFHHNSGLYSSGYTNASPGLYSNYIRVKAPSNGESYMSLCKDPYCAGCQLSLHNQQILMNGAPVTCPSGCTQCDHQKYNLALAMSFAPGTIPSSLSYTSLVRPYVCNWMTSDTYCGKRFVTSEELLQHLRSHTSGIDTTSAGTSTPSLLNPSFFTSTSLHQPNYLNTINPLSSGRYHPYNKVNLQNLMGPSYSAFSPTLFGSYYSPYPVYNQRPGPATVHP